VPLKRRDAPPRDPEKLVVKRLRLAPLVLGAVPIVGEYRRAGFEIVPVEAHGLIPTASGFDSPGIPLVPET
jgi:hypothetical protein